jgi:hypothetical protein
MAAVIAGEFHSPLVEQFLPVLGRAAEGADRGAQPDWFRGAKQRGFEQRAAGLFR